ncbi:MAG: EamA family transporter [Paludibacteraceae bacterium]|nr:EamA family transporter [Paludibacteraceae bacterium]
MTWVILAFLSALCLGFYDISKKVALRDGSVVDVLTASVLISSCILLVPLLLSRLAPLMMTETAFFVPALDLRGHLLTVLKSVIVLSSWLCAYLALKHLPISIVSPWQATRPMWTLIGAMLIFGERLNPWQWLGVLLAIGSIFVFQLSSFDFRLSSLSRPRLRSNYYLALALAILIGAGSGLYDKYIMRLYDHNAVQVYYTLYQAVMMLVFCYIHHRRHPSSPGFRLSTFDFRHSTFDFRLSTLLPVALISVFLVISDNVYMLALQDPDSMIAVVSTIRRGGTVIGFAYGLIFLKEKDPYKKVLCMLGILAGLICLALGS